MTKLILTILVCALLSTQAHATIYYISPTGSNSNSGVAASDPWLTFAHALPQLAPGDTLTLLDGIYHGGNSGFMSLNCTAGIANGTAGSPITVVAQNERQAFLQGTGNQAATLFVAFCSYWTFEGLRVESADFNGVNNGSTVHAFGSDHLTFRRLLVQFNNRYKNSHALLLGDVDDSLVEENEVYCYHRHAISLPSGSNRNIVRRNYTNSRSCGNITGGYPSGNPGGGDVGVITYPGSDNIFENNITEDSAAGFEIEAQGLADGNQFLGNIALETGNGFIFRARGLGITNMPQNTIVTNGVAIASGNDGSFMRSTKNTQTTNSTSINSGRADFSADEQPVGFQGDGNPTVFYKNVLAVDGTNTTYGFFLSGQFDHAISYSSTFGQPTPYDPVDPTKQTNNVTFDPVMGTCYVWIPDGSPLKGAGENGADIGANVLYRYEDGVLTETPLWDVTTGEFPCGAQVAGVNDIAGESCFDVHERLNVNTNGCAFPVDYGNVPDTTPPDAPTNVQIVKR